jgi:hypothetical protein
MGRSKTVHRQRQRPFPTCRFPIPSDWILVPGRSFVSSPLVPPFLRDVAPRTASSRFILIDRSVIVLEIIPFGRASSASWVFKICASSSHLPWLLTKRLCSELRSLAFSSRPLFFRSEQRNDRSDLKNQKLNFHLYTFS